jgi:phosphohistidine phosphatase
LSLESEPVEIENPESVEESHHPMEAEPAPSAKRRLVIFLRHGIAEDRTGEKPDADRSLTREGHAKMKEIGKGLATIVPKAEIIYSSPLLRAVQTALWVSKAFKSKVAVKTTDALAPEASYEDFKNLLDSTPESRVIFVGHEPTLSRNAAELADVQGKLELKKGGCYGVRIDSDSGATLEWILSPRVLRRLR